MTRLVAFLRGINVNGINIKMADLKGAFEAAGFTQVRTVLASGNVLFETTRSDTPALKRDIEARLSDTFGYQAWVVLLDLPSLRRVVDGFPFPRGREGWHAYAVLSSDVSVLGGLLSLQGTLDPLSERIQAGEGVLYWAVRRGLSTEGLFGRELSRARYKAATTTRNLNTLARLL